MTAVRRIIAAFMVVSFAGLQTIAAGCAMMTHVDTAVVDAGGTTPGQSNGHTGGHAHTTPAPADQDDSDGADPGTEECALMLACASAALVAQGSAVVSHPRVEIALGVPLGAHLSPSLAFDPPPPRTNLI